MDFASSSREHIFSPELKHIRIQLPLEKLENYAMARITAPQFIDVLRPHIPLPIFPPSPLARFRSFIRSKEGPITSELPNSTFENAIRSVQSLGVEKNFDEPSLDQGFWASRKLDTGAYLYSESIRFISLPHPSSFILYYEFSPEEIPIIDKNYRGGRPPYEILKNGLRRGAVIQIDWV